MTTDDSARRLVKGYLEGIGYRVTEIPEGDQRSADLWASAPDDQILIEVKSRVDDKSIASSLRDAPPGKSHVETKSIERLTALGRLIEDAVEQRLHGLNRCGAERGQAPRRADPSLPVGVL